jgi:RNA polymerase sigma-70 factor (ECF subfamily)
MSVEGTYSLALPDGERTQWLLRHEAWLRVLARHEVNQRLGAKFDPSDVVQQTLIEAWQGWDRMDATDEPQRQAWLRQILAHQLAHFVRHYQGTQKRDLSREVSLDESLCRSSERLGALIPGRDPSPSNAAATREQQVLLARVLESLADDYRQVIVLRSLEELSYAEIAQRMDRSEAAVRMLWLRALAALSTAVGARADAGA